MATVTRSRAQKRKLNDGTECIKDLVNRNLVAFCDCGEREFDLAGLRYVDDSEISCQLDIGLRCHAQEREDRI